jgi:cytochrome c biogenesis protein CcmG/thiol:disulfide interchange protein DsbE
MQRTIKFIIILISLFIISIFFLSLGKDQIYNTEKILIGKKLDQLSLKSFDGDNSFNTNDFKKNNFTLINFWASWCAPCRIEHPILMNLQKTKKLKLVGINFKDKKNNAKNFLQDLGNPYHKIAKDENGKKSVIFGIYGIPESILINEELIVIHKFVGPLSIEDYDKILEIIN